MAYSFAQRDKSAPPTLRRVSDFVKDWPKISVGGLVFVSLLIGGLAGTFFGDRLKHPRPRVTVGQNAEVNALISVIARHFVVPVDETPLTVATVAEPEQLKAQSPVFYRDVIVGDRLVVWKDRAVLYSPSRDTVLAAMVALQTPSSTPSGTIETTSVGTATSTLSVEVRNASGVTGATKPIADVVGGVSGYATNPPTTAKAMLKGVLVVPVSDRAKSTSLDALVTSVGGTLGAMPAGEKNSQADIVIFVGKK